MPSPSPTRALREVQPNAVALQGSAGMGQTSGGSHSLPISKRGQKGAIGNALLNGVLNGHGVPRGVNAHAAELEKQRVRRTESLPSLAVAQCLHCSSCVVLDENLQFSQTRRPACSQCRQRSGLLLEAARRGNEEDVLLHLGAGASPCFRDENGFTALHYGAAGGHTEVCRALLEHPVGSGGASADTNAALPDGSTPLMLAVEEAHIDVARLLLEKGASAESKDEDGFTALNRCDANVRVEFESCL